MPTHSAPRRRRRLLLVLLLLLLGATSVLLQRVFAPRATRVVQRVPPAASRPDAAADLAAPTRVTPPGPAVATLAGPAAPSPRGVPLGPPTRAAELAATVFPLVLAADDHLSWPLADAQVKRARGVTLDDRLLGQHTPLVPGARVQVALFPEVSPTVALDQVTTDINGTRSFVGHLEGQPQSTFIMSASTDGYVGLLKDDAAGTEYQLRWRNGEHQGYALEDDLNKRVPVWGGAMELPADLRAPVSEVTEASAALPGSPPLLAMGDVSATTVDLLMVYDTSAAIWAAANGGITTLAAQAIARVNLALANSQVALTIRLVGLQATSYTHVDLSTDLTRLTYTGDGYMEEVPAARNLLGADLVTLWVDTGSATGWIGQAWQLTDPTGFATSGFSDFDIEAVNTSSVMAHELMHNFGAGHAKTQTTQPGPGLFNYAAGYYFTGTNGRKYHTIMAYNFDGSGTIYDDCDYYSNPAVSFQGAVTGVTSADAVNGADNHLCITNTMGAVANYRTAASTATLFNGVAYTDNTASGDKAYYFDVPAGIYSVTVQTTGAPTDILDLAVNLPSVGFFPASINSASKYSAGITGNETVSFTSISSPAVQAGRYYILAKQFGAGGSYTITATYTLLQPPVMTGPTAGALALTPAFTWNTATGADHYELWVDDLTAGRSPFINPTTLTGTTYTSPIPFTPGNVCQASMRTVSATGEVSPWSTARVVTVGVLGTPTGSAPSGSLATLTPPLLQWSAVTGATSYDVWVNDLTTATSPYQRNAAVVGTSWTLPVSLIYGHNYSWMVRASGGGQTSPWSSTLTFAAPQLGIPGWGTPVNTNTVTPTLSWSAVPNATTYDLYLTDLTSGADPVQRVTVSAATTWTPSTPLNYGHNYRAYIRAQAGGGNSDWSSALLFSIAPLGTPVWGPATNATTATPTLSWGPVASATGYELYVADLTSAVSPYAHPIIGATTTWTFSPPLLYGHVSRVYIRALAGSDVGPWSSSLDFNLAALGQPTVTGPTPAVQATATPIIAWTAVTNATQYDLYVVDLTSGTSPVARNQAATGTTWTCTALPYGHNYRVYARAGTATQWGDWNLTPLDFSTVDPNIPVLTAPSGLQTTGTPTFTWGAVGAATDFDIYVADLTLDGSLAQRNQTATGTTWTPITALIYGHSYRVWARARVGGIYTEWSAPLSFAVAPLGLPTLTGPTPAVQATATPIIAWSAVSNVTQYDLYVVDLTSGTSPVARNQAATGTTWTCTALPYGHNYRVYVRAGTATQWGDWNLTPLDFSTVDPNIPVLTAPTGLQTTGTPTFTWGAVGAASDFDVYVADLTLNGALAQRNQTATGTAWTPVTALTYGHSYRVWARARVGGTYTDWSAPLSFAVAALGQPTVTGPTPAVQATATPIIAWTAVTNATQYDLYVVDLTSGTSPVARNQAATGTTWTCTTLPYGHNYRVYARAGTATQWGDWNLTPLDFSTVDPNIPVFTAPSGVQSSATPTFTWGAVGAATDFDIYVLDLTSGESPAARNTSATGTTWTPATPLHYGHAYRAWIRARIGGVYTDWSGTPADFSVSALGVPALTAPSGAQGSTTPAITWLAVAHATSYDIYVADLTLGSALAQRNPAATGTSWTPAAFTSGHSYRVWSRALSGSDASAWSSSLDFSIP